MRLGLVSIVQWIGLSMSSTTRALIAIMFVNFVTISGFGFLFPVFAIYGKSIDASATEITLAIAAFSFGQFISSPFWGQVSDKVGRKPILVVSLLVGGVLSALNVFAVTPELLILARFVCGLAAGSFSVAFAVAADLSTPQNRTRVMGIVGAGFSLGFIMGPAIGGLAAGNDPGPEAFARVCYFGAALFGAGGLLALFILPETRVRQDAATAHASASSLVPPAGGLKLFTHPVLAYALGMALVSALALANMEATFAIFAEDVLSLPPSGIGLVFGGMGIIGAVGQFAAAGPLSAWIGERGMLLFALGVLGIGMVVVGTSTSLGQAVVGMGLIACGFATVTPAISGLASLAASTEQQGTVLGYIQSASAFGRVLGPAGAGVLYDRFGPPSPFMAAAIILGFSLIGGWFEWRAARRRHTPSRIGAA